jgi:hypothetical protein
MTPTAAIAVAVRPERFLVVALTFCHPARMRRTPST